MRPSDAEPLHQLVDTDRYPLTDPGCPAWQAVVDRAGQELAEFGCTVLPDLVRPAMLARLRRESTQLAPRAHYASETVNVYNIALDSALPPDHPGRITAERGNAFVARDLIPAGFLIHQLYVAEPFQRLVADCFSLPRVYPLADGLAGLCLNVLAPGRSHSWHFDTNEFTVSMLTQQAAGGGVFEYCPNIRSADDERFAAVRAVLTGQDDTSVRRMDLRPGDVQLFKGRYALHRVSQVEGDTARHTAIFAYSGRPGVVGSPERTRQLFGRVLPEHLAPAAGVRDDELLD